MSCPLNGGPEVQILSSPPRARSSTDRASDYGSEGWGFESLRAHKGKPRLILCIGRGFGMGGLGRGCALRIGTRLWWKRGWFGNALVASLTLCAMMWMGAACVLSMVFEVCNLTVLDNNSPRTKDHAYRICCPNSCGGWAIPTCSTLDKHGFHSWRLSSPGFMKCHDQTPCLERVLC